MSLQPEVNKQWLFCKRPEKEVTSDCYKLVETPMPTIHNDGEILVKAEYISVDPYLRIQHASTCNWAKPHPLNTVQASGVVGRVIESLDTKFGIMKGDYVLTQTGWQLYAVARADAVHKIDPELAPISAYLGVLGLTGMSAYFGLLKVGDPNPGETIVVSAAAGAVGSIAVQLAKHKVWGSRVIGIAGGDEKCAYVEKELGADKALDYKKFKDYKEVSAALKEACPKGIDVYFDNVGGMITDGVFENINTQARIVICGQISQYNTGLETPEMGPRFLHRLIYTRATIQGFLVLDWETKRKEFLDVMGPLVRDHKITYRETIVEGFEKLPEALNGLFRGENIGKMLVKV